MYSIIIRINMPIKYNMYINKHANKVLYVWHYISTNMYNTFVLNECLSVIENRVIRFQHPAGIHMIHVREMKKEGRSKHCQTNIKARQHSTPKAVTFPNKNELPRVGFEPTTLYTLDRCSSAGWARILHLIVYT